MVKVVEKSRSLIVFSFDSQEVNNTGMQVVFADGTYRVTNGSNFPVDCDSRWKFKEDGRLYFNHPWQDGVEEAWFLWVNEHDIDSDVTEQLITSWILEQTILGD